MYGSGSSVDVGPKCGKLQMLSLKPVSIARARVCQNCGYVQELYPVAEKPVEVSHADTSGSQL